MRILGISEDMINMMHIVQQKIQVPETQILRFHGQ